MRCLLLLLFLAPSISAVFGADAVHGFVRKSGTYSLSDARSLLTIRQEGDAGLSWKIQWIRDGGSQSISEEAGVPFRAEGWFVFLESINRTWFFDGVDQLTLVHRSGSGVGSYSVFRSPYVHDCPEQVIAAVPGLLRRRIEDAARATKTVESTRTSTARD